MKMDQPAVDHQPTMDLKVLRCVFPDGQVPDWYIPPERTLALIPGFKARYQSTKRILDPDCRDAYSLIRELREFSRDFFWAWEMSSPMVLEVCGASQAMAMLELFAFRREMIWDYEYVPYYERLPDRVEIFRGGAGSPEDVLKGFSWSLWPEVAEQFAARSANGIVLKAEVAKEDVLLISCTEWEVVPRLGALSKIMQV